VSPAGGRRRAAISGRFGRQFRPGRRRSRCALVRLFGAFAPSSPPN